MMQINTNPRINNKAWLTSFVVTIVTFAYQICSLLNVVPPISQDLAFQLGAIIINILVGVGVVMDPTTPGVSDSDRAMTYGRRETYITNNQSNEPGMYISNYGGDDIF